MAVQAAVCNQHLQVQEQQLLCSRGSASTCKLSRSPRRSNHGRMTSICCKFHAFEGVIDGLPQQPGARSPSIGHIPAPHAICLGASVDVKAINAAALYAP
eukprot:1137107-Pelagomonas_calceolata.AAC.6